MTTCTFIPPYLLQGLSDSSDDVDLSELGQATLEIDTELRERRRAAPPMAEAEAATAPGGSRWSINDAHHTRNLPGDPVRAEGDPATGDEAADEAYAGIQATWELLQSAFSYQSVDGRGTPIVGTVHYGRRYSNAFWDGRQLVFGDGDGRIFGGFTKPIDVLAHEFAHGVTQHTAGLAYEGQSGALNESVSDVFGSMVKQRSLEQTAEAADWLIGEGIFMPGVNGKALRSMKAPGTAYDDPRLGKDPQVGSMSEYVDTTDDNGGVHLNSGIPNRAFYLAATGIGGNSWEGAGPIWWKAITDGEVTPRTDFAGFAQATVDAAVAMHGEDSTQARAVRDAWTEVEVLGAGAPSGPPQPSTTAATLYVRRSGGIAGLVHEGHLDVTTHPAGREVTELLEGIDMSALPASSPMPDQYVYTVKAGEREVQLGEQDLTPELSRVIQLVLGSDA